MKKQISSKILCVLCLSICLTGVVVAQQLSGDLSVGYVLTDDTNNQSLSYERYNYYDGANLSLNNFTLKNNGIVYSADLNNITMNNRNLWLSIYKPSRFKVVARHNKFRRIYDANEAYSTKRSLTDVTADLTINRNLSLFGSFTDHQSKGKRLFVADVDSLFTMVDYSSQLATGGLNYASSIGNITAQYSYTNYDDDVDSLYIQKTNCIHMNGALVIPGYHRYRLFGGFTYQQNQLNEMNFNQNNYHGWIGTKVNLAKYYYLEYRFLYNRTTHEGRELETDTWHHLVSLARNWKAKFGIRAGFDYVIADDLLNKTNRSGFLLSGWARPNRDLYLKFETNYYDKSTDYGNTLYGATTYNRNKFSIQYATARNLTLTGNYMSRFREDENIGSSLDYGKYGLNVAYLDSSLGALSMAFNYAMGDYQNMSATTSYEFNDYYFGGSVSPRLMDKLNLTINATYYKAGKDRNFQKVILSGLVDYQFYRNWSVNVVVNQFDVEDKLLHDDYNGHILAFNLVSHFEN